MRVDLGIGSPARGTFCQTELRALLGSSSDQKLQLRPELQALNLYTVDVELFF